MAVPTPVYRIDLNNDGDFSDTNEDVTSRVLAVSWTRGANAVFGGDAVGSATLTLSNDDGLFDETNMLPGLPVHIYATYSGTDYPRFYGYTLKWSPDPANNTVRVTVNDILGRMAKTDVVVAALGATRTARDLRIAVLEEFERGTLNLCGHNPSFETNTTGWTVTGGTLTKTGGDNAPGGGSSYGAFVASAGNQTAWIGARLAPQYIGNQTYRWSIYVKVGSGTADWTIGLGTDLGTGSANRKKTVTVTTSWQRVTLTYTMPATQSASAANPLAGFVTSFSAGTIRLDNAAITRGQALYPYAATGTGRWPNYIIDGSFESGAALGWYDAFHNLCTNGNFESGTTGWSGVTQITTAPLYLGSAYGRIGSGSNGHFDFSGTFKSGVTYRVRLAHYANASGANDQHTITLGSIGTPADTATSGTIETPTGWVVDTLDWTPSADRTDARLKISTTTNAGRIDAVSVYRLDTATGSAPAYYMDTGPGGGGSFPTAQAGSTGKYGNIAMGWTSAATATSGRVYDLSQIGPYFVAGESYVLSVWLFPTSNMAYKVGLAANKGDGSFEEPTPATGTATANTWTQITLTWTPSADYTSSTAFNVMLYVYQTDTTSRTVVLDGVRLIPGSSADDFEMARWDLSTTGSEVNDLYLSTASLSGSALSCLATLNGLALTRHFVRPTMTSPFYDYVTIDRDTFAAQTSQETYTDDPSDANGFGLSGFDIDQAQIRNIVKVTWDDGEDYYSDSDSVDAYGPLPAATVSGAAFFPDRTIPDSLGPALVARFKDPHPRPTLVIENRFPSQLQRELGEVVTIDSARLGTTVDYVIVREDTEVIEGGNRWRTKYTLEKFPY